MSKERSNHAVWAEEELRRAGLYDEDSDYEGMLGPAAMKLVDAMDGEGHSGFSAAYTVHIFDQLAAWKPLTPITCDPEEWMHIAEEQAGQKDLWQSRRASACFSNDEGRTYYDIDEPHTRLRRIVNRVRRFLGRPPSFPLHTAKAA